MQILKKFCKSRLKLKSATKIKVEPATTTAATLTREERLQQSRERGEISRLNQQLTRPAKLRHDTLTTHHAAEESRRRFAQRVLRRAFPRDEMARINDVAFARLQSLAMNRAKG